MTEPNAKYLGDGKTPIIVIDGKEWPVPPLVVDQLTVCYTGTLNITVPMYKKASAGGCRLDGGGGWDSEALARFLTPEIYQRINEIIYTALTRAHPDLTFEEFGQFHIPPQDAFAALSVIAFQTGYWVRESKAVPTKPATEGTAAPE